MTRLAEVALPAGVEKTFTYLVPPEMEEAAVPGARVLVPFGKVYRTGVVVDLPGSTQVSPLRALRDVLDPSPVLSDDLLRLCRWMAEYYMAPMGEVVKAALPQGFMLRSRRLVRLREYPPGEAAPSCEARGAAEVLAQLRRKRGEAYAEDLAEAAGVKSIFHLLHRMEKSGLIRTEEVMPPSPGEQRGRLVVMLGEGSGVRTGRLLEQIPLRKKALRRLLAAAVDAAEGGAAIMEAADLSARAGTSAAVLREAAAAGLLRTERRPPDVQAAYGTEEQTRLIRLNEEQQKALLPVTASLQAGSHTTVLLHGVTGSGKTQVYIEAIRVCLHLGKGAVVLVPEIALTPQTVRRFRSHFGDLVAVVHSRMPGRERQRVWRRALAGECSVVIGPRSAVFAPVRRPGLIVVDEEHDASYKQQDARPRYHARDAAVVRGFLAGATVLLGSATPSIESYFNALSGKYRLARMPRRVDEIQLPPVRIINMADERRREYAERRDALPMEARAELRRFRQSSLSLPLREAIGERLARGELIILLQNRRGFAPFVECSACGYAERCDRCSISLTWHAVRSHLRCHYCGLTRRPHDVCPACGGPSLELRGAGTQRVEQELREVFPSIRVLRMDMDTTSERGAHERILEAFGSGEADVLLGTQMVAKGLDFPRVTLVGVVSADTQMLLPDFRSSERTFQLLTQVAGRAGRSTLRGEVLIQTHQPDHYTLEHVRDHDYRAFYEAEIEPRRDLGYPPFTRLVLVETSGIREQEVQKEAEAFAARLAGGACVVLGPAPAAVSRIRNQYRWHTMLKSSREGDPSGSRMRAAIRKALAAGGGEARGVRISVDVDPAGLM
ncbi:MAG: primosomal protein N' [Bacteroidota bacterium]